MAMKADQTPEDDNMSISEFKTMLTEIHANMIKKSDFSNLEKISESAAATVKTDLSNLEKKVDSIATLVVQRTPEKIAEYE
jgi:hypothetical protein